LATSGMPFSAALVTGLAVDKINEGKINLNKNIPSAAIGDSVSSYYPKNPFAKEFSSQLYEYLYKNNHRSSKNEKE
ncbi:hypothetical protein GVX76_05455, partial [[Haemophilus] felis]|nr:hypothetical protein [[Haemophilus] felis]